MNIIETKIPDVTRSNISEHKELIANNIIKNVYPLFDEVYQAKLEQVSILRNKIKTGKTAMKNEKETMQQLMMAFSKEKKVSKILSRVEKLVQSGLANDGSLKHETVILLKIVDKLPTEKLDQQLAKTMQILSKRFSK
jgi:hypothetical protein